MNLASFDPVTAVLLIPIGSAALLAVLPGYRLTARLNVVASLATFLSALSLFMIERPHPGPYVLVDDLNIVFVVISAFVGFTTSVFSASYIGHEIETGRLSQGNLRFYHAMYQALMCAMATTPGAEVVDFSRAAGRISAALTRPYRKEFIILYRDWMDAALRLDAVPVPADGEPTLEYWLGVMAQETLRRHTAAYETTHEAVRGEGGDEALTDEQIDEILQKARGAV